MGSSGVHVVINCFFTTILYKFWYCYFDIIQVDNGGIPNAEILWGMKWFLLKHYYLRHLSFSVLKSSLNENMKRLKELLIPLPFPTQKHTLMHF